MKVELHPYFSQVPLVKFCHSKGIHVTAYSPLGQGRQKSPVVLDDPKISDIAKSLGEHVTPAQVILAWIMERGIVAIPKSVTESRIKENHASLSVQLSKEQMEEIDSVNIDKRFILGWVKDQFKETQTNL